VPEVIAVPTGSFLPKGRRLLASMKNTSRSLARERADEFTSVWIVDQSQSCRGRRPGNLSIEVRQLLGEVRQERGRPIPLPCCADPCRWTPNTASAARHVPWPDPREPCPDETVEPRLSSSSSRQARLAARTSPSGTGSKKHSSDDNFCETRLAVSLRFEIGDAAAWPCARSDYRRGRDCRMTGA